MGKSGSVLMLTGASVCGALISYAMFQGPHALRRSDAPTVKATGQVTVSPSCAQALVRVPGYKYVHHLLAAGTACESPQLVPLRDSLATAVEALRRAGQLTGASVHIRAFKRGEWTAYNGNDTYTPGDLRDLVLLIAAFSQEERTPGTLDRNIGGTGTSLRTLLHGMISGNDGAAREAVQQALPHDRVTTLLAHLGLPATALQDDHRCTAAEYTTIMASLFNAADLSPMNADKVIDILVNSALDQGMTAAVPPGVEVAGIRTEAQTSEGAIYNATGIVYAPTGPYVITILAKGTDRTTVRAAAERLGRLVYDGMVTKEVGAGS